MVVAKHFLASSKDKRLTITKCLSACNKKRHLAVAKWFSAWRLPGVFQHAILKNARCFSTCNTEKC
jgi:hypothetical protein